MLCSGEAVGMLVFAMPNVAVIGERAHVFGSGIP